MSLSSLIYLVSLIDVIRLTYRIYLSDFFLYIDCQEMSAQTSWQDCLPLLPGWIPQVPPVTTIAFPLSQLHCQQPHHCHPVLFVRNVRLLSFILNSSSTLSSSSSLCPPPPVHFLIFILILILTIILIFIMIIILVVVILSSSSSTSSSLSSSSSLSNSAPLVIFVYPTSILLWDCLPFVFPLLKREDRPLLMLGMPPKLSVLSSCKSH